MKAKRSVIVRILGAATAGILSWFAIAIVTTFVLALCHVEIRLIDAIDQPRVQYGIHLGQRLIDQGNPLFFVLLCNFFAPATSCAAIVSVLLWKRWSIAEPANQLETDVKGRANSTFGELNH